MAQTIEQVPYPWQHDAWQNWQGYLSQGKVPHAVLVHGRSGCGIEDFTLKICCSLLCSEDNIPKPCLKCNGCRLFLSGNHPDILVIEAEQEQIKVEQVRKAIDFLQLSRHYLSHKIVLFKEVDNLNYAATNSLLKTLEEPPAESVILMTCRQPSTLTATIRSRCHRIYIKEPTTDATAWLAEHRSISEEEAKQKLMLADDGPLSLLNEDSDNKDKSLFYDELDQWINRRITTLDFVEHWCDKSAVEIQQWLLGYLHRIVLERAKNISDNQDNTALTESNLSNLLYWLYQRQIARCRLAKQNINPRLLLEGSLMEWRKAYHNN